MIFNLRIRETMQPESRIHFKKMFPNTFMNDRFDVPRAGKPQLLQSGAMSSNPFTGSWSINISANLRANAAPGWLDEGDISEWDGKPRKFKEPNWNIPI